MLTRPSKNRFRVFSPVFLAGTLLFVFPSSQAKADTVPVSTYAYQQALSANNHFSLYDAKDTGFKLNSSYFSGLTSGVGQTNAADATADRRLYALLVDGRYDFNRNEITTLFGKALRPYLSGGMGMASSGAANGTGLTGSAGDVAPLFRVGGGVAYKLDKKWDLSLDYNAGMAMAGDQVFTGRNQQSIDLQSLNIGMRYAF